MLAWEGEDSTPAFMARVMKKRLGAVMIIAAIVLSASVYPLLHGVVRFNYPSESEFPIRGIDVSHHQGQVNWGRRAVLYVTSEFYSYVDGHFSANPLWVRSVIGRPRQGGFRSWALWQYANRGHVQGISTFVDLNVYSQSWAGFRTLIGTAEIRGDNRQRRDE